MSPFEEMTKLGKMGAETYELFVTLTARASTRYPPPPGFGSWGREACQEWLHEYFIPHKGAETATKLSTLAVDDASFAKLAFRALANALVDWARATPAGRMQKRLRGILPSAGVLDASGVMAGDEAWTVRGNAEIAFSGDWRELLSTPALSTVGAISSLNPSGPTSQENRNRLSRAAEVLLTEAGGAMRARDLATALVTFFELDDPELFALTDQDYPEDGRDQLEAPGEHLLIVEQADTIWAELSPDERVAFALLGSSLAAIRVAVPAADREFVEKLRVKAETLIDRGGHSLAVLGIVRARSLDIGPAANLRA